MHGVGVNVIALAPYTEIWVYVYQGCCGGTHFHCNDLLSFYFLRLFAVYFFKAGIEIGYAVSVYSTVYTIPHESISKSIDFSLRVYYNKSAYINKEVFQVKK